MNRIERLEQKLFSNGVKTIIISFFNFLFLFWILLFIIILYKNNFTEGIPLIFSNTKFFIILDILLLLTVINWINVVVNAIQLNNYYKSSRTKKLLLLSIFTITIFIAFFYLNTATKDHDYYYKTRWELDGDIEPFKKTKIFQKKSGTNLK